MNRLDELRKELGTVFGRLTKWRARCQERNALTEAEQIKLAEEVLAEPCSGTVAEARTHSLSLEGVQTLELDDFLGKQKTAKVKRRKRA